MAIPQTQMMLLDLSLLVLLVSLPSLMTKFVKLCLVMIIAAAKLGAHHFFNLLKIIVQSRSILYVDVDLLHVNTLFVIEKFVF